MVRGGGDAEEASAITTASCNPFTVCTALILVFIFVLAVVLLYLFLSS